MNAEKIDPVISGLFESLGVTFVATAGLAVHSPIDGRLLAWVSDGATLGVDAAVQSVAAVQASWARLPAPARGDIVRRFGQKLREHKQVLGRLVSLEVGKILQEGIGEVQEMIDICDFATGLSRQLYGLTIASERPQHKMLETWHPFGICGVISAFNFPVAVWAWNAALALVCGNGVVWKPSDQAPLSALAAHGLLRIVLEEHAPACRDISAVVTGGAATGRALVDHAGVRLISATGSTAMGRGVGVECAARFKRSILELGGNNAAVVCASADIDSALRAIVFAAVGTAGQRCTSLRRLFVHHSVYDEVLDRLKKVFGTIQVGNPLDDKTLVGPLVNRRAFDAMQQALQACRAQGNRVTGGERLFEHEWPGACYVRPAIVETDRQHETMLTETFAPVLYAMPFTGLHDAIRLNNDARHGLSSCIFTDSLHEAELFTSGAGSDCGIVNVNIGTSGAEIGGAFGGEKDTGGGRESGSDAWKNYMRRATSTINYAGPGDGPLPLAQGIRFDA